MSDLDVAGYNICTGKITAKIANIGGQYARGAKDALDYVLDCTVKDYKSSFLESINTPRILIPLRPILGVLQIGIKSQGYREPVLSMSDSEDSTVTYTEISSPYEDLSDVGSPGAEGPIFQDPPSPDYVPGPEEPEQAPPSPIYVPFVPEPVYPEFLHDDEIFPA
ncbi:hypothetical protein Tco_1016851 [Tanacetum coccineum]|uniref:Uncharacterized protein n=1 Tax=Tanacetum coccineum TaxID=301880 RepID=A0ABQ5FPY3_9ASTR